MIWRRSFTIQSIGFNIGIRIHNQDNILTIEESNEKPQTVEVINLSIPGKSNPNDPFGAIAFAVPTLEAALAGMEDKQSFDVAMNGKTLAGKTLKAIPAKLKKNPEIEASLDRKGHQVNPRQAIALFGQRGWISSPDEGLRRTFHKEGIIAIVSFANGYYTPSKSKA